LAMDCSAGESVWAAAAMVRSRMAIRFFIGSSLVGGVGQS
jgi:hypothetical protein